MEKYTYYFKYLKGIVGKFYKSHFNIFKDNAIDLDDLQQEMKMTVLRVVPKIEGKVKEEAEKILATAVVNDLKIILRKCPTYNLKDSKKKVNFIDSIDIEKPESEDDENISGDLIDKISLKKWEEEKNHEIFNFEDVKEYLTEKEFQIISMIVKDCATIEKVAKYLKVDPRYISRIYKKTLRKLNREMFSDYKKS
jgi:RNA polymerase sigma factor (sigma-70 family)